MNTFNQRTRQREATAAAVLEAARAEFESAGFEAASIRSIAARAGVAAGTVIHHFKDKRELLHAALFDDLDRTLGAAFEKLGDVPLEAQLSKVARRVFKAYEKRAALSRISLKESLFADPPWAQKFAAQTGAVHASLTALVAQAIERRELKNDADAPLFALAWLSFFYFALIGWVQGALPKPVGLVERLTAQHLEGLRRRKS